jgi:curved DNA-binding protein CbpA
MASTFYEVLGVSRFASDAEIKKAFKDLAKKYHPDKHPGEKFYEEHFKKINEAYQTLSNPQTRQRYDLRINYTQSTPPPRQQYRQSANQQRTTSHKQATYTNYKKPQANRSAASQKKLNKYYVYIGIGAFVFIIACIWFYNFMNEYASNEYYTAGLKEEQKGNTVEAMGYFFSSLEKDLNNPKVNEKVGDIYTKLAQNNSLELFYFDLDLQKKNIDASLNEESGNMYRKMRGIDSLAAMYYNRALENYEFDTDKRRVGLKLVRTDLKTGNTVQALYNINSIQKYADTKRDDSILYYKANINFQMKHYAEARRLYTSFFGLHSNSADAYIKIALCHYNESNEDFALGQLNKAIARFPENGDAYYFKGEIIRRSRDSISACTLFRKADSLNVLAAKPAIYKYCKN